MNFGHTLGIALGTIAVALAALSTFLWPDDYGRYLTAFAAASEAASLYLLHNYPTEVAPSPPQLPSS